MTGTLPSLDPLRVDIAAALDERAARLHDAGFVIEKIASALRCGAAPSPENLSTLLVWPLRDWLTTVGQIGCDLGVAGLRTEQSAAPRRSLFQWRR